MKATKEALIYIEGHGMEYNAAFLRHQAGSSYTPKRVLQRFRTHRGGPQESGPSRVSIRSRISAAIE